MIFAYGYLLLGTSAQVSHVAHGPLVFVLTLAYHMVRNSISIL